MPAWGLKEKRVAHYEKLLPQVAVQTSALERRADEAERETEKMKKCEYMSRFVGQTFEGVISGVTNWGFMWSCLIQWKVWCASVSCGMIIIFLMRADMSWWAR